MCPLGPSVRLMRCGSKRLLVSKWTRRCQFVCPEWPTPVSASVTSPQKAVLVTLLLQQGSCEGLCKSSNGRENGMKTLSAGVAEKGMKASNDGSGAAKL